MSIHPAAHPFSVSEPKADRRPVSDRAGQNLTAEASGAPLRPSPQNFRNAANAFRAAAGLPLLPARVENGCAEVPAAPLHPDLVAFRERIQAIVDAPRTSGTPSVPPASSRPRQPWTERDENSAASCSGTRGGMHRIAGKGWF